MKTVPKGKAPALDAIETKLKKAEAAVRTAQEKLQQARLAQGQRKANAESLERELKQAEEQEKEAAKLAKRVEAGLEEAGFEAKGSDGATKLVAALQKELQALEAARKAKADLEAKLKEIEQKRAKLDADVAAATAQRDVLKARLQELERKNEETDQHLDETQLALGKLAKRDAWIALLPPPLGKDESDVVESLRENRQRETAAAQARVATLTHEVQATEKALLRAAELLERRLTLDRDAALAKTLADHLKAHELIAWIQEEALVRLAEAGSRHLQKLSQSRYTLRLGCGYGRAGRPRRTGLLRRRRLERRRHPLGPDALRRRNLPGFLALALALAESLAELGAESRATEALDSPLPRRRLRLSGLGHPRHGRRRAGHPPWRRSNGGNRHSCSRACGASTCASRGGTRSERRDDSARVSRLPYNVSIGFTASH